MKIAVLSDIHDHIWNLQKAIKILKKEKCEAIVFCGDMCAPFTAGILGEAGIAVYTVWGNADEDHWAMVKKGGENMISTPLAQEFGEVELGGRKIAYCHYPKLGELLAKTEYYDAVFHGHTHRAYQKKLKKTLVANPGAACGIIFGKVDKATFMIYDTKNNSARLIKIKSLAN